MKFLLDTDTVSFALRGEGQAADRLLAQRPSDVAVSAVTVAELRFGASKRGSKRLHRLIDTFLEGIDVLPFDTAAAERFGDVAADLARSGQPLGMADMLIAAHALATDRTLVSHNVKHFGRIEDLLLEDWY